MFIFVVLKNVSMVFLIFIFSSLKGGSFGSLWKELFVQGVVKYFYVKTH